MNSRTSPFTLALVATFAIAACLIGAGCSHSSDSDSASNTSGATGGKMTAATPPPNFNVANAQAEQQAKNRAADELKRKLQGGGK